MFFENIKEAVTSIFSNKMRSVLTMLGIIIGISAVITITTIGSSIQTTLTSTLNSLGGNTVQVYVSARYPDNDEDWATWEYPDMKASDYVTQEMINELMETYPDEIKGVVANEYLGNGQIRQDKETYIILQLWVYMNIMLPYSAKWMSVFRRKTVPRICTYRCRPV